jgi:hypothetical protein
MLCSKKEKTTAKLGYIRAKMSQGYRENEHCCTNYFTNEEASPQIQCSQLTNPSGPRELSWWRQRLPHPKHLAGSNISLAKHGKYIVFIGSMQKKKWSMVLRDANVRYISLSDKKVISSQIRLVYCHENL